MPMTADERAIFFLAAAANECTLFSIAYDEMNRLSEARHVVNENVVVLENGSVFIQIRSALQAAGNLSKIFWPLPAAKERGEWLRAIADIPEEHALKSRRLRNHIEHLDERLDSWVETAPRFSFSTTMVVQDQSLRTAVTPAIPVIYDASTKEVHLFGEAFNLETLSGDVLDLNGKVTAALTTKLNSLASSHSQPSSTGSQA